MARNGTGVYSLPAGNPFITGTSISSTTMNSTLSDIANALTQSLSSDGQTTPTANLPMGNYKLTGLGNGSALQDSAALGQVQSGAVQWLTGVSGTDTITAGISPTPAAYAAGQAFRFVSAGANTGPVTLNISSLGVRNVTKTGAVALSAGDIPSGAVVEVVFDGTRFQISNVASSLADGSVTNAKLADGAASGVKLGSKIQSISASVSANALTISASALSLDFRSTTLGSGTVTTVTGTPANLVISSGSTLGTVNAVQSDIAVLAINNAGTIELAAVNIAGGTQLDETNLISTTAEGGAGAADSATVVYSTTARTNVAYRVLGIIRSTQTTAGTWATSPSLIQGAGGQAVSAMSSIGYGQTWQSVTGSRAKSTTYYNTTGRPIFISISANGAAAGAAFAINVNGAAVAISSQAYATSANTSGVVIVPAGASYSMTDNAGTNTINNWLELR